MFEETMADNFPKLMADTKPQIQEAQRTPTGISTKNDSYCNCRTSSEWFYPV